MAYKRVAQLRNAGQFKDYCEAVGADLPMDDVLDTGMNAPLAQPYTYRDITLSNRFSILPMEGWDGTTDGHPSDLTYRRWKNFGPQWCEAYLGRRGCRCASRWARECQTVDYQ